MQVGATAAAAAAGSWWKLEQELGEAEARTVALVQQGQPPNGVVVLRGRV